MFDKEIEFTDELWIRPEEGVLVIGVKQEMFDDIGELWGVDLPAEGGGVTPEEICGEVETDQGPINIYSPIEGEVLEVNAAVVDDPSILASDSTDEGWLLKIQPLDAEELESYLSEAEGSDPSDED